MWAFKKLYEPQVAYTETFAKFTVLSPLDYKYNNYLNYLTRPPHELYICNIALVISELAMNIFSRILYQLRVVYASPCKHNSHLLTIVQQGIINMNRSGNFCKETWVSKVIAETKFDARVEQWKKFTGFSRCRWWVLCCGVTCKRVLFPTIDLYFY